jgi:hypothetical protein
MKMRTLFSLAMASLLVASVTASSPSLAQQKTIRACLEEWRANKADNQAKGISEMAYVARCRAGGAAAQPTAPPAHTTGAATPAENPAPSAAKPAASGANQFVNEAQARARCPSDTVVWINLNSKIYHFSGHGDYGHTKQGAYMCERDTAGQGYRAAKNEKHP